LRKLRRFVVRLFALTILLAVGGGWWFSGQLKPLNPSDTPRYVRFENPSSLGDALTRLQNGKILRNATATRLFAKWKRAGGTVRRGTYTLGGNMTAGEVLEALKKPIRRMVRLPETNWAQRTANLLEKDEVGPASKYMELTKSPSEFNGSVSFPLPQTSLEGYLFPDTYDIPPLTTPKEVIRRQLAAFEQKIWKGLGEPKNLHRAIIIASMVEMEVARDSERPIVAGVIENRLKLGMPLQIDAAINYGIQKWRPLTYDDYKHVDSPYNLYTHKGLPPGPICSPSLKSIEAALNPTKHNFLYYVALPSGLSLLSSTYAEHLKNVQKRRDAIKRGTPE